MRHSIILLIICVLSFSCKAGKRKKNAKQNINGTYSLIQQFDNGQQLKVGFKDSKIIINADDKTISAYVGCNSISGEFIVAKNQIAPMNLIQTEKACLDYIDGLEMKFVENLGKVNRYELKGNILKLYGGEQLLLLLKK